MADVNAPIEQAPAVAPPTRTNEQILPRIRWVPIGKSNCYLDAEKVHRVTQSTEISGGLSEAYQQLRVSSGMSNVSYHTKDTPESSVNHTINNNKLFLPSNSGHSRQSLIVRLVYRERLLGLKGSIAPVLQILWASSISLISLCERMWKIHSIHLNLPEDKKNLHNTLRKKKATLICDPSVSAKGTKREVFGMPILNELITDDIRGADYYDAYLKKVAKHQRYLAAPKAATKKPQPAPTKPKEKKRKQAKETTEATPPAKRAKAGKVAKKRTLKKSQQLVDEFVDEGIPLTEPGFGDLEADTQRAIEESLKDAHGAHRGPLPPVVFRETDTGKFQPLPEVEGKGKEKFVLSKLLRVLLNLQTPKKKSPTEQYIFQRCTFAPTEPSGHEESSSLYAELGLTESDMESDEEVPPVVKSGAPDEGQAGPNPGIQDKGEAGPNPGNDIVSQTLSTPGVHAGLNLEHTDAEATDAGQPQPGQMDEEFTATVYPNNQENLKLTLTIRDFPRSLPALQGLVFSTTPAKRLQLWRSKFFNDNPPKATMRNAKQYRS
ncbi:hypothetical protein Tco_1053557 [Tanacetum coccineum]|uniref:Uncharacterized protein n=1 Tax=Tanacetum coccineum TaxID=301880 RepID=A0ABQ5GVU1_9ASTR